MDLRNPLCSHYNNNQNFCPSPLLSNLPSTMATQNSMVGVRNHGPSFLSVLLSGHFPVQSGQLGFRQNKGREMYRLLSSHILGSHLYNCRGLGRYLSSYPLFVEAQVEDQQKDQRNLSNERGSNVRPFLRS